MPFSEADLAAYKEVFDGVAGSDGNISSADLKTVTQQAGFRMSDDEIEFFIGLADKDGKGQVSWDEFVAALEERPLKKKIEAALRRLFDEIDTDGSGSITADDLKKILAEAGATEAISDAELDDLVKKADPSGDGKINFDEFLALFLED